MKKNRLSYTQLNELSSRIKVDTTTTLAPQRSPLTIGEIRKSMFMHGGQEIKVVGSDISTLDPQAYINKSEEIVNQYLNFMMDSKNRSPSGNAMFRGLGKAALRDKIELLVQAENLDLSLLNKVQADEIYKKYREDVLQVGRTFEKLGVPGLSLPSESKYKHFLRYIIDPFEEVAAGEAVMPYVLNLMRTSYNPPENASSIEDFSTGRNRMRNPKSTARLSLRTTKMFPDRVEGGAKGPMNHLAFDRDKTYTILTWDTETTGLVPGSQIREISLVKRVVRYTNEGVMEIVEEPKVLSQYSKSFASDLMDLAGYVSADGSKVTPLSEAAFISERGGFVPDDEMIRFRNAFKNDGTDALNDFKDIMKVMLNKDDVLGTSKYGSVGIENLRLEGHNSDAFDLGKFIGTIERLPGYKHDAEARSLLSELLHLRQTKTDYVVDTLDSANLYFRNEQSEMFRMLGSVTDKNGKIVNLSDDLKFGLLSSFSISPEMFGTNKGTESLENLFLNTNFFELLEKRLGADGSNELLGLMQSRGTHTAGVDAMLNAYVSDFINNSSLRTRKFPTQGMAPSGLTEEAAKEYLGKQEDINRSLKTYNFMPENKSITAFEKFMRGRIRRSSSTTPITNIADIQRVSDNVFQYLHTDEGRQRISLAVDSDMLNKYKIKLNDSTQVDTTEMGKIFYDKRNNKYAFSNFEGNEHVGSKGFQYLDDTDELKNLFKGILNDARKGDRNLIDLGGGKTIRANASMEAIANISMTELEATELDQMMAARKTANIIGAKTLPTDKNTLSRALSITRKKFENVGGSYSAPIVGNKNLQYTKELIESGLPYATLDVRSRIMAAADASATAKIGETAINRSVSGAKGASSVLDVLSGKELKLYSEMGIQYAQAQGKESVFGGKYRDSTGKERLITNTNSYFRTPIIDPINKTQEANRVIINADDMAKLVVNEFDENGNLIEGKGIRVLSKEFAENAELNNFIDSKVQAYDDVIGETINRAFAPKNLSERATQDLAEQVISLNTEAFSALTKAGVKPSDTLQKESMAIIDAIFNTGDGQQDDISIRMQQLQELAKQQTRKDRHKVLRGFGRAGTTEGETFVKNYNKTVESVAQKIETTFITGFKVTGEAATKMVGIRELMQMDISATDAATQSRSTRFIAPIENEADGIIGAIFGPSTTGYVDEAARNLVPAGAGAASSILDEDQASLKGLLALAEIDQKDIKLSAIGATDEQEIASKMISVGREFYSQNKGKFAIGALALAGTITGYKMAKRQNENDGYNGTMDLAPVEQGQRPYGIQEALMGNGQTSRRKDPLFTAGVVGNLDRQKIGHTSMGPSKHSHLFGDS